MKIFIISRASAVYDKSKQITKGRKVRYKEAACGFVVQIKFPFQKGRMFIRNFTFIPAECL
ncbi:hypothetical protein AN475_05280 [Bacillus amyloliquefaciens]|nr:hypothetical protein AN475_05280 [Bacillus amyloliquefaciens]PAC79996.1 hypothetical protein CHI11_02695 [Bacillus velezensis]